jgi:glucosylceramidase
LVNKSGSISFIKKKVNPIQFSSSSTTSNNIVIDETKQYQDIDGFGFTLTGGSAELINKLEKSTCSITSRTFWKRK